MKQAAAIAHANQYWAVQMAKQRSRKGRGNSYFISCQGTTSPGEIKGSGLADCRLHSPEILNGWYDFSINKVSTDACDGKDKFKLYLLIKLKYLIRNVKESDTKTLKFKSILDCVSSKWTITISFVPSHVPDLLTENTCTKQSDRVGIVGNNHSGGPHDWSRRISHPVWANKDLSANWIGSGISCRSAVYYEWMSKKILA